MDLLFRTGKEILRIDIKELSDPLQEGKIKIFFYKDYIVKALPVTYGKENFFSKISDLKRICEELDEDVKNFVSFYGLPFANTIDLKNYLEIDFADKSLVLLYRKPSLSNLSDYLGNEDPLSDKRKTVYKNLIRIVSELDKLGIKLLDLYPDNFLVDEKGNVYISDLIKAGIINENNEWKYKPLIIDTVNRKNTFPLPPEINASEFMHNSNIWLAVYLIYFVLTGGSPFDFLSGKKILDNILLYSDTSQERWPPVIPLSAISNINKYNSFSKKYNSIFKKGYFSKILINTYVRGYKNPHIRPTLQEINKAVLHEIGELLPNEMNTQNEVSTKSEFIPEFVEEKFSHQESPKQEFQQKEFSEKEFSERNISENNVQEDIDESKLSNLPFSVREYIKKIVSNLKKINAYNLEMKKSIESLIDMGKIYFVTDIFAKNRDIHLVGLILKFVTSGYWNTFILNLQKLSEISSSNLHKIILKKVVPVVNKYKKMNINPLEYEKEIFLELNSLIYKEIASYKKKSFEKRFNIFLLFVVVLSLSIPWILFYIFKWNYLAIIIF
ncbi:MAG: hypothetical protein ACK4GJ_06285, partial [bacterium]